MKNSSISNNYQSSGCCGNYALFILAFAFCQKPACTQNWSAYLILYFWRWLVDQSCSRLENVVVNVKYSIIILVVICFFFRCHVSWFLSRAIRHPASGYVQGINDLATPFLVVFLSEHLQGDINNWSISDLSPDKISDIEADCYWCLSKLLDGMQDHYTFAQPGIQRLVFKLKELVRRIDGRHLILPRFPSFFFLNPISCYS